MTCEDHAVGWIERHLYCSPSAIWMRSPTCAVTVGRSDAIVTRIAPAGAKGDGGIGVGVAPGPATLLQAAARTATNKTR